MAALPNARHEQFAQRLVAGDTTDRAYQCAGFKAHRGNAARLSANESIKARVAELQQMQVRKVHEFAAINVREQMHKLIGIVDDARAAGDLTTAMKGQMYIMKMFGFEDMPTLTHEMLGERGLGSGKRDGQPDGEPERKNILQFGPAHQKLEELIAARTIEHDPQKK